MKRLALAILATAIGLCANAQQQTILQGRITDSERHEAMAGVTVYAEDGSAYTSSNGEGRYVLKLNAEQASGNIDVNTMAVGCTGRVYLTIPGERKGEGKVQITINESVREYQALTDGDTIKTDTPIKVVEVINESTLLVEELNSYIV